MKFGRSWCAGDTIRVSLLGGYVRARSFAYLHTCILLALRLLRPPGHFETLIALAVVVSPNSGAHGVVLASKA